MESRREREQYTCWREIPSRAAIRRVLLAKYSLLQLLYTRVEPAKYPREMAGLQPAVRRVSSGAAWNLHLRNFQKFHQRNTLVINIIFSGLVKG